MSTAEFNFQTLNQLRNSVPARAFRDAADRFCGMLQGDPASKDEWCVQITTALSELYAAGHRLPEVDIDGAIEVPDSFEVEQGEWQTVYKFVQRMLARQSWYWAYFDPSEPIDVVNEQAMVGDLADDLADIYRDVRPGLLAWDSGRDELLPLIVFNWKHPLFLSHWGIHAVSALRALHPIAYLRGVRGVESDV